MRIAVFGTGAVGGYFGGRLAEAGESVVFIARGQNLAALQRDGLRVSSILGDFTVAPAEATDDAAQTGPVDVVLLGVKAWQVPEAAIAMRPLLGPDSLVVPLQNGIEAADQLRAVLGAKPVLGGLCRVLAWLEGPGHVRHAGLTPTIAFAELDGSQSPRVERLREVFRRAQGVTVETPRDIKTALWAKLMFIAAVGGVGAATRAPAGVFRSLPETRELLAAVAREVMALARVSGATLGEEAVAKILAAVDGLPETATSSMQRDLLEGRPSELEAQLGAVVRLAREKGVPAPAASVLYASLLPLEKKARGELAF